MPETVNATRETKRNFLRTLGETEKLTRPSMVAAGELTMQRGAGGLGILSILSKMRNRGEQGKGERYDRKQMQVTGKALVPAW